MYTSRWAVVHIAGSKFVCEYNAERAMQIEARLMKRYVTSLCRASYVSCKRGISLRRAAAPCCCDAGGAAIDRYLPPVGPTAANPSHVAAAGVWVRQTDGWTRYSHAYHARSVHNRLGGVVLFWLTDFSRSFCGSLYLIQWFCQSFCRSCHSAWPTVALTLELHVWF